MKVLAKGSMVPAACFLVCIAFLIDCKLPTSQSNRPPSFTSEASWVAENIDHSYTTKHGIPPRGTAFLDFWIRAADPDGAADVSLITATAPDGQTSWILQDRRRGTDTYDGAGRFWGGRRTKDRHLRRSGRTHPA